MVYWKTEFIDKTWFIENIVLKKRVYQKAEFVEKQRQKQRPCFSIARSENTANLRAFFTYYQEDISQNSNSNAIMFTACAIGTQFVTNMSISGAISPMCEPDPNTRVTRNIFGINLEQNRHIPCRLYQLGIIYKNRKIYERSMCLIRVKIKHVEL